MPHLLCVIFSDRSSRAMTWLFIKAAEAESTFRKASDKANIETNALHVRDEIIMLQAPHCIFHCDRSNFFALSLCLLQRCTTQAKPGTSSKPISFCCSIEESRMT